MSKEIDLSHYTRQYPWIEKGDTVMRGFQDKHLAQNFNSTPLCMPYAIWYVTRGNIPEALFDEVLTKGGVDKAQFIQLLYELNGNKIGQQITCNNIDTSKIIAQNIAHGLSSNPHIPGILLFNNPTNPVYIPHIRSIVLLDKEVGLMADTVNDGIKLHSTLELQGFIETALTKGEQLFPIGFRLNPEELSFQAEPTIPY